MSKKAVIQGKEYDDPNVVWLAEQHQELKEKYSEERDTIRDLAKKEFANLKSEKRAEMKSWGASDEWLHQFDEKIDTPQKLELADSWLEEEKKTFPGFKYVGETPLDTLQKLYKLEDEGDQKAHDLLNQMYAKLDNITGVFALYKCNYCGKPITVTNDEERPDGCPHCGNEIQGV